MASSLSAANRRQFYRNLSWLFFGFLVIQISFLGRPKKEASSFPREGNSTTGKAGLDYVYEFGFGFFTYQQYNLLLVFFTLYLDFCLNKSEEFIYSTCKDFKLPIPARKIRYFPRMSCYWMELMLAVEVVTPFFLAAQYVNAFTMYYHRLPFKGGPNTAEVEPTALTALWILSVYATWDGMMQLGWQLVCCLLYRKVWFSSLFGPEVRGDLEWFLSRLQSFADWVFLNQFAQEK